MRCRANLITRRCAVGGRALSHELAFDAREARLLEDDEPLHASAFRRYKVNHQGRWAVASSPGNEYFFRTRERVVKLIVTVLLFVRFPFLSFLYFLRVETIICFEAYFIII